MPVFCCQPQGRRRRAQPHRRHPRVPLRPLVEPGGGGPGHGPDLPHRPEPQRAGAQADHHGHPGGEDRRHAGAKRDLAEGGGLGEGWLTELDDAELAELVSLGPGREPVQPLAGHRPSAAGPGAGRQPEGSGPRGGARRGWTPSSSGPGSTPTGCPGGGPTPARALSASSRVEPARCAAVQGSRAKPYKVHVRVRKFDDGSGTACSTASPAGSATWPRCSTANCRLGSSTTWPRPASTCCPGRANCTPLLVPGLGRPVQARRRGLLPGGGHAGRRPVRDVPAARPRP